VIALFAGQAAVIPNTEFLYVSLVPGQYPPTNPYLNKILGGKEVKQDIPDLISQIKSIIKKTF
jgi:hypothetical protein